MKRRSSITWGVIIIVIVLVILFVIGVVLNLSSSDNKRGFLVNNREASQEVIEVLNQLVLGRETLFLEGQYMAVINSVSLTDTDPDNSVPGSTITGFNVPQIEIIETERRLIELGFEKLDMERQESPTRSFQRFKKTDEMICDVSRDTTAGSDLFVHAVFCGSLTQGV